MLGAGAITDLLRIVQAGLRGNSLRRPVHLSTLLAAGLVHVDGQVILVRDRIPALDERAVGSLPLALRRAHENWLSAAAENTPGGQSQGNNFADDKPRRHAQVGRAVPKGHGGNTEDQAANPGGGKLAG